jgi:hypothetical protein
MRWNKHACAGIRRYRKCMNICLFFILHGDFFSRSWSYFGELMRNKCVRQMRRRRQVQCMWSHTTRISLAYSRVFSTCDGSRNKSFYLLFFFAPQSQSQQHGSMTARKASVRTRMEEGHVIEVLETNVTANDGESYNLSCNKYVFTVLR